MGKKKSASVPVPAAPAGESRDFWGAVVQSVKSANRQIAQHNREHGLDSADVRIKVTRFVRKRAEMMRKLAEGCRTFGDVRRKLARRYAAFRRKIVRLSAMPPSMDRLKRTLDAISEALLVSCRHQDLSVGFTPELAKAVAMLADRPKTPKARRLKDSDFLFSDREVVRIVKMFIGLRPALNAVCTEIHIPEPPAVPNLAPAWKSLLNEPDASDFAAYLFDMVGPGKWRYRGEMFGSLSDYLAFEADVFALRGMLDTMPIEMMLNTMGGETAIEGMLAFLPIFNNSMKNGIPEEMLVRGKDFISSLSFHDGREAPTERSSSDGDARAVHVETAKSPAAPGDGEPCKVETYGRFRVERRKGSLVVEDTAVAGKPYRIGRPDCTAARTALKLIRDYAAGNRQTARSRREWVGAFQAGRGDATRFYRDQVFKLPKWNGEKGRYMDGQFCGLWRIWTDEEMAMPERKRVESFKKEFPHGFGGGSQSA